MTSYARNGFGLWLVELLDSGEPAGMCGLIRREGLEDADIGYAFLPEHWGVGYAQEACTAALTLGREHFGLSRVVAIVSPWNTRSVRVLEHLGFADEGIIRLKDDGEPLRFFGMGLG
jgi:RimJ/RimL family protein N-acetyltransferase